VLAHGDGRGAALFEDQREAQGIEVKGQGTQTRSEEMPMEVEIVLHIVVFIAFALMAFASR
jgi:hypothetical protein